MERAPRRYIRGSLRSAPGLWARRDAWIGASMTAYSHAIPAPPQTSHETRLTLRGSTTPDEPSVKPPNRRTNIRCRSPVTSRISTPSAAVPARIAALVDSPLYHCPSPGQTADARHARKHSRASRHGLLRPPASLVPSLPGRPRIALPAQVAHTWFPPRLRPGLSDRPGDKRAQRFRGRHVHKAHRRAVRAARTSLRAAESRPPPPHELPPHRLGAGNKPAVRTRFSTSSEGSPGRIGLTQTCSSLSSAKANSDRRCAALLPRDMQHDIPVIQQHPVRVTLTLLSRTLTQLLPASHP